MCNSIIFFIRKAKARQSKTKVLLLFWLLPFCSYSQTFRTIASGNWNGGSTIWESDEVTPGTFASTATIPNATNSTAIFIQSGHTITLTSNVTLDQTIVASTAGLVINNGQILTISNNALTDDLILNGVITNNGTIAYIPNTNVTMVVNGLFNNVGVVSNNNPAKLIFNSGSTYDHKFTTTAGTIPVATWHVNSTVKISGYTTNEEVPDGINQPFGNFIWDCPDFEPSSGYYDFAGQFPSVIYGNLTIKGNIDWAIYFGGVENMPSLQVNGNFVLNDSYVVLTYEGTMNLTVGGNLEILAGATLELSSNGGNTTVYLKRNFIISPNSNFSSTGLAKTIFIGNSNNTEQAIISSNMIYGIDFAAHNTTLVIGPNSFIQSDKTFYLDGASTLKVGSTSSQGVIRVSGTATYAPGATIVFNGTSLQTIAAHSVPSSNNINLIIENSAGVKLNQDLTIASGRILTLSTGNLDLNGYTLTVNGNLTGQGGISTGSSPSVASICGIILNGSGNLDLPIITSGEIGTLTINKSAGEVVLKQDLTVRTQLNLQSGNFNINDRKMVIYGTINSINGKLKANTNTNLEVMTFRDMPTELGSLSFADGSNSINTLTIYSRNCTLTINGNITVLNKLNLKSGILNTSQLVMANGSTLTKQGGTISTTPTSTGSFDIFYLTPMFSDELISIGAELPSDPSSIRNLTISAISPTNTPFYNFTLRHDITVNGNFVLSNGHFSLQTYNLNLKGDLKVDWGPLLQANTGTVTMNGNGICKIINKTQNLTLSNLIINNPNADVRLESNNISVTKNFKILSGRFTTGNYSMVFKP